MLFVVGLLSCTTECGGPACESAWPASILYPIQLEDLGSRTSPSSLPDRILGRLVDGAKWSLSGEQGELVIGMPEAGAVVRIQVGSGVQELSAATQVRLERPGEAFGAAIALVDTDGDGVSELWVGAPDALGGRGAVYRFQPDAVSGDAYDLRYTGGSPADALGSVVRGCGDVTGDGRSDVVVGAPWFVEPVDPAWEGGELPSLAGAVFLLHSEGLAADENRPWVAGTSWWGPEAGAGAGWELRCREDLSGNGLADVVIGAPFVGDTDAGVVFVREGGALESGILSVDDPFTILPGGEEGGRFGSALATRGRTLVIGAPHGNRGAGYVSVYRGLLPSSGSAEPVARFDNPRPETDHFGLYVALGDVDGDGVSDLWVGAPDRRIIDATNPSRTRFDSGAGWLWLGAGMEGWSTEITPDADRVLMGEQPFQRIGRGAVMLDLDGEGRDEIVLPSRAPDPGR